MNLREEIRMMLHPCSECGTSEYISLESRKFRHCVDFFKCLQCGFEGPRSSRKVDVLTNSMLIDMVRSWNSIVEDVEFR